MSINRLRVTFELEGDNYVFTVSGLADDVKRKKQKLRFSLLETAGNQPILIPAASRVAGYCGEKGEFTFTLIAENGLFTVKEYQIVLSVKMFDWIPCGQLLTLRIDRLEDDGSVSAQASSDLLINSGGRLTEYSDEKYLQYLAHLGKAREKLAFAQRYAANPDKQNAEAFVRLLTDLAGASGDGEAEYCLSVFYSQPNNAMVSKEQADIWLRKAAQKKHQKAMHALGLDVPKPSGAPKPAPSSLEACLQSAEEGDRDAQYALYQRYSKEGKEQDQSKAMKWLTLSAQNGLDDAVVKLEQRYLEIYYLDANVREYINTLQKAAENGSSEAYYRLFSAKYTGECLHSRVKKDKRQALAFLKKAADGGNIAACYRMWQIFEDGNDLLVGEQEAVGLLKKAADNGNADAMNDLGELYVYGRIVEKNGKEGVALIQKAAEHACFDAQVKVFHMWFDGRYYDILFDIDHKKAYELMREYAKGNPKAQMYLWHTYVEKNPVMLTRLEALDYLRRAADEEYLPAVFEYANVNLDGAYKDVDTETGMQLLEKGAKLGCTDCQLALFELYYNGAYLALERPVNKERSYKWIALSSESNAKAMHRMWELFCDRNELELESEEAVEMLFASGQQGCGDSLYDIAILFAQGKYVYGNIEKAMDFLSRAAEQGHAKSMYKLYEVYISGAFEQQSVQENVPLAHKMLLLSAQLGFSPACAEVWRLFNDANPVGVDRTFAEECRAKIDPEAPAPTPPVKRAPAPEKPAPAPAQGGNGQEKKRDGRKAEERKAEERKPEEQNGKQPPSQQEEQAQ